MIEQVVALLMFVNGEIKEHRIQENMAGCLRGKRHAERNYSPSVKYQCWKGKAETEIYMGEKSIKAILSNSFNKKINFTRFVKSQLSTTKNGKLNVEILKGQESFRIKSFVKSNIWVLLPAGKSKFKKGDIVDCFFPNLSNQNLV